MLLIFNPAETERPPHDPALPVPAHGARGPGHIAFAATAERARPLARAPDRPRHPNRGRLQLAEGARSIYVRDPAGNSVELAEPRLWGFEA